MIRCNYSRNDGEKIVRHAGVIVQAEKCGVKGWQMLFKPGLLPEVFMPNVADVVEKARRLSVEPDESDVRSVDEALMVWPFVAQSLSWEGDYRDLYTEEERAHAYKLCNGFGLMPPAHYDWSHVRDSSASAIRTVGEYLRDCLNRRGYRLDFLIGGGCRIIDVHVDERHKVEAELKGLLAAACRRRLSLAAHLFDDWQPPGNETVQEVRGYGQALVALARRAEAWKAERAARNEVAR